MSFSIVRAFRQPGPGRRRPVRRVLDVEPMESRALLTSAAVASAISSIQSAEASVLKAINTEIATLKSNIVTIEKSTATFISKSGSGDKAATKDAIRDEKYAIGQQLFLIDVLDQAKGEYDSTLNAGISGLKSGRLDPTAVPKILAAGEDTLQSEVSTVESTATYELDGLTGTFAAGKA